MNDFLDALHQMEAHVECTVGVTPTRADDPKLLFNGVEVSGTVTPIEMMQPFSTGGYTAIPNCEVAIPRTAYMEHGIFDPTNGLLLTGKNLIDFGVQKMRVLSESNDLLSSRVILRCGPRNR